MMDTSRECICCREVDKIIEKMQENDTDLEIECITDHEGFEAVCLNRWVLQAAYFAYREQYGNDDRSDHE